MAGETDLPLWRVVAQLPGGRSVMREVRAVEDEASILGAFLAVADLGGLPAAQIAYHRLPEPRGAGSKTVFKQG